jgi:microcystin-dependent protein
MADPYLGEIRIFGGNFAPVGWALCDGSLLSIGQFDALYSLLGTTYGGDGQSTFGLPDLRGRVAMHMNTTYPLGAKGGVESVTLTQQNLPLHTHLPIASTAAGSQASPNGALWATSVNNSYSAAAPTYPLNPVQPTGGSQPHDNIMPFVVINYIIATEGIYPNLQ